jgi:hypothetical protein
MEEHMFGESTQSSMTEALLFLAVVGLTVVSTIDLFRPSNKRKTPTKNIDVLECFIG